ncbi:60S ribosomal protein L6-B [Nadsonia fulvescens var. elongata DSM 6958]|uniref:60S ribosomal protein L6 n=1 Tax=Nadsonia fulvescens var. elongata DSM 6958 TaxID=857566 RepID=A0A1E3PK79_9ASCO|nr:60S ribosomal protein L6-B [Nadsonia fulvescens var. elongata DSM 6958]
MSGTNTVIRNSKAPKWYETDDSSIAKKARKAARPQALRASIVPGSVLIILAGRFRGKRVVCLKALEDNTLLISGPFKVNGVPLRRVNPRYVIATSTKVSVESLDVKKFDVAYFAHEKKSKKSAGEKEFFGDNAEKKEVKAERVADQKTVDAALLAEIKKTALLKQYLASSFSLKNGDRPHALKF